MTWRPSCGPGLASGLGPGRGSDPTSTRSKEIRANTRTTNSRTILLQFLSLQLSFGIQRLRWLLCSAQAAYLEIYLELF